MSNLLSSISIIVITEGEGVSKEFLLELADTFGAHFVDVETIIVANGLDSKTVLEMKKMLPDLPDTTVHFLERRVDLNIAKIAGMENAVHDYVLLIESQPGVIETIPDLMLAAHDGYDDVIVVPEVEVIRRDIYGIAERIFFYVFSRLSGTKILSKPPPIRLFRRPAALYIVNRHDAEILLRSAMVASVFPSRIIEAKSLAVTSRNRRSFYQAISKGFTVLSGSTTVPIRIVSYIAMVTAVISLLYSIYVLLSYFIREEIAPGWASLSLQLSLMLLVFSIFFGMLAEYIVQIHGTMSRSRRPIATHEMRSGSTRRHGRLNIVDQEGRYANANYMIGAPPDYCPRMEEDDT